MSCISLHFPDKPIAWSRPARSGSKYYDPQLTAKQNLRKDALHQLSNLPSGVSLPLSNPLECYFTFFFAVPSSYSKKRQQSLVGQPYTHRPDTSNLIKFYEDALQGLIFFDDKQIVKINALKRYALQPCTNLIITTII